MFKKTCWIISIALLLLITAMSYLSAVPAVEDQIVSFVFRGHYGTYTLPNSSNLWLGKFVIVDLFFLYASLMMLVPARLWDKTIRGVF